MPRTRQDRSPERTDGITVELTEFGLWIEVHRNDGGGWEGIFLSARALRRLVALPAEERLAALAALDPATLAARQPERRRTSTGTGDGQPGAASRAGERGREWGADRIWE